MQVMAMEARRHDLTEDQELVVTDRRIVHRTCYVERDVKIFREQLSKQIHWYSRRDKNGKVTPGQLPQDHPFRNTSAPVFAAIVGKDEVKTTVMPRSHAPVGILTTSSPKPKAPQQHPGNVVITKVGDKGYGTIHLEPATNPSAQPTVDIREDSKTVMKKRVVSIASEASSDTSEFQVVNSPLVTRIEEEYQTLLKDGKASDEALQILMHRVNTQEMPSFLEWMNTRMPQLSSTV